MRTRCLKMSLVAFTEYGSKKTPPLESGTILAVMILMRWVAMLTLLREFQIEPVGDHGLFLLTRQHQWRCFRIDNSNETGAIRFKPILNSLSRSIQLRFGVVDRLQHLLAFPLNLIQLLRRQHCHSLLLPDLFSGPHRTQSNS